MLAPSRRRPPAGRPHPHTDPVPRAPRSAGRRPGLIYTPNTDIVEESQGWQLAKALADEGYRVTVYDPLWMGGAERVLNQSVRYARSAEECVRNAHLAVLAYPLG